METYSQASQDLFVRYATNNKKNGYFLEIGASNPILYSNTYLLEKNNDWQGIMIEYDSVYEQMYIEKRKSKYIIQDARTVNYVDILSSYPKNMDYLQIDLDVDNKSTLEVLNILNNTIFDTYKFATITFEHDIYRGNYFDTREISRQIFAERGYVAVFKDIAWCDKTTPFEDWYVNPDLVNMEKINCIKTDELLTYVEVKKFLEI